MPYTKKPDVPFGGVSRLIRGYGVTITALAEILRVSRPTARKLMDNPECFSLRDLDALNRYAHIPLDEIRQAARK